MYEFLPGAKESEAETHKYTITTNKITISYTYGNDVYNYKLEDFIGYKLYLTDADDNEAPTFVFEHAEKIEPATVSAVEEEFDFEDLFVSSSWHFTYTKGEKLGSQRYKMSETFPSDKISADWKEDYYITDISYGGSGAAKEWVLVTSKNNYTDQLWQYEKNITELKAAIEGLQKTKPGHYITHLVYGDGKWVLVASSGTGYTAQTTIMSTQFPEETIKENWKKDFHITDMDFGGDRWTVVMSKGSSITSQHYHIWDSWEQTKINSEIDGDKYLTEIVKHNGKWYTVFSEDKNIYKQETDVDVSFPKTTIRSNWDAGYTISSAFYY